MPASHLRRRSRDRENARYDATEENDFFPVHNFMGFLKIKSAQEPKVPLLEKIKSNKSVTFPRLRAAQIGRCGQPEVRKQHVG